MSTTNSHILKLSFSSNNVKREVYGKLKSIELYSWIFQLDLHTNGKPIVQVGLYHI